MESPSPTLRKESSQFPSPDSDKMQLIVVTVLAAAVALALATGGVDVSQPTSTSAFGCMKSNGRESLLLPRT
jgi:hypothetical protein